MAFLRVWQPSGTEEAISDLRAATAEAEDVPGAGGVTPAGRAGGRSETASGPGRTGGTSGGSAVATPAASSRELTAGGIMMALVPYLIVIAVFSIAKLFGPVKTFLVGTDVKIEWPGLNGNVLSAAGKPISSTIYNFQWLSSPGSLLVLCGILVAICYRMSPAVAAREYFTMAYKLRWAFLTVASVLALAYVMNQSGQTLTIGNWIAATGAFFAFLSPVLGWLGTAVTGSDTSANALFATLQQAAAEKAGLDPTLLVAANTTGGVVGKMISPQNLTIAATAVGILGREGDLFRYLIRWSLGMILFMCVLVYLQSTPVLGWML
jgi:lactate permease